MPGKVMGLLPFPSDYRGFESRDLPARKIYEAT